ncbi:MAG: short-chain dehydrogenase/reductase [Acidobacteria bacterium]|nr:MAG: short-chain dehydrogenase/reductase [Acidobacteriota bacterium]
MMEQVILVTGCSTGIGRATALLGKERGHRVFASARRRTDLAGLAERGIETIELDVTDPASVDAAVGAVLGAAGRIDALVNNAGYGQYGAVEDVTLPEWRAQFEVNVFGALRLLQAVLPTMREKRKGTIVNVSSVAGKVTIPFAGPYCASKHALEAVSDALRVEVAPWKIRVVVIEPGPIATHFGARTREVTARILQSAGPYSRFYANAERASEREFQRGTRQPELVARVIVRAIESRRPKTRYRVAPMAKILVPLKGLASDRFLDRRLKRALKLPDSI